MDDATRTKLDEWASAPRFHRERVWWLPIPRTTPDVDVMPLATRQPGYRDDRPLMVDPMQFAGGETIIIYQEETDAEFRERVKQSVERREV